MIEPQLPDPANTEEITRIVALITAALLVISEILGLLRQSPYRGLLQTVLDIARHSYREGKLQLTLPRPQPHFQGRPPDLETPPPSDDDPATPGSTVSLTPTVVSGATSYFTLASPVASRRNQH